MEIRRPGDPTPGHTLTVRRFTPGATDVHGNPVNAWAAPEAWHVWALAPGSMEEPGRSNRDLSLIEWTVYAPASDEVPTEKDLVEVDGVEYAVEGRASDWTRGPWPHPTAGVVVELRRAEG